MMPANTCSAAAYNRGGLEIKGLHNLVRDVASEFSPRISTNRPELSEIIAKNSKLCTSGENVK